MAICPYSKFSFYFQALWSFNQKKNTEKQNTLDIEVCFVIPGRIEPEQTTSIEEMFYKYISIFASYVMCTDAFDRKMINKD